MAREKSTTRSLVHREPTPAPISTLSWNPLSEIERMWRDVESLFAPFGSWPYASIEGELEPLTCVRDVDLSETDNEVVLSLAVPGLTEKDLDISVTQDVIAISGERKSEHEETEQSYLYRGMRYGSFCNRFRIPAEIDPGKVTAKLRNGILEVRMPKVESERPKSVKVTVDKS